MRDTVCCQSREMAIDSTSDVAKKLKWGRIRTAWESKKTLSRCSFVCCALLAVLSRRFDPFLCLRGHLERATESCAQTQSQPFEETSDQRLQMIMCNGFDFSRTTNRLGTKSLRSTLAKPYIFPLRFLRSPSSNMPFKIHKGSDNSEATSTFFSRLLKGKTVPIPLTLLVSPTTPGVNSGFPLRQESRQLVEFAYSPNSTRPTSTCAWEPLSPFSRPRRSSSLSIQSTSSAFTVTSYATTPLSTPRLVEDDTASVSESENNEPEDYFDDDLVLFFSRHTTGHGKVAGDDSEQLGFADMMLEGNSENATEASTGRAGGEWERRGRLSLDVMDWDLGVLSRKESDAFLERAEAFLESKSAGTDGIERGLKAMGF